MNIKWVKGLSLVILVIVSVWALMGNFVLNLEGVKYFHIVVIFLFGFIFEIPSFILDSLTMQMDVRNQERLKKIIRYRYILSYYIAPSLGLCIVASGLYLSCVKPVSLTESWLFWLITLTVLLFLKGIFQHNRYIGQIYHFLFHGKKGQGEDDVFLLIHKPFDHLCLRLELPVYLLNILIARFKPGWIPVPGASLWSYLETKFSLLVSIICWITCLVLLCFLICCFFKRKGFNRDRINQYLKNKSLNIKYCGE